MTFFHFSEHVQTAISTYYTNSADDKLMTFFLFFLGKGIWHFMQCIKFQILFSRKSKKKKIFKMSSAEIFNKHAKF